MKARVPSCTPESWSYKGISSIPFIWIFLHLNFVWQVLQKLFKMIWERVKFKNYFSHFLFHRKFWTFITLFPDSLSRELNEKECMNILNTTASFLDKKLSCRQIKFLDSWNSYSICFTGNSYLFYLEFRLCKKWVYFIWILLNWDCLKRRSYIYELLKENLVTLLLRNSIELFEKKKHGETQKIPHSGGSIPI